jgi:hypothetical protein
MFGSDVDFKNLVWKSGEAMPKCAFTCCCKLKPVRKNMIKSQKANNKITGEGDVDLYMNMVVERLGNAEFLSGAEIGMLDLSLYGITYQWANKPTMVFFQAVLDKYPVFAKWWLKMYQAVGEIRFTGN